jgi:hypothetical protein
VLHYVKMFSLDELTWRPVRATMPNRELKFGQVYDLDCEASLCVGPLWQYGWGNCFVSYCPDGSNSDVVLGAWCLVLGKSFTPTNYSTKPSTTQCELMRSPSPSSYWSRPTVEINFFVLILAVRDKR